MSSRGWCNKRSKRMVTQFADTSVLVVLLYIKERFGEPARLRRTPKAPRHFQKLQPPKKIKGFLHFFPFLAIAYTSCPFFGHILVIWNSPVSIQVDERFVTYMAYSSWLP